MLIELFHAPIPTFERCHSRESVRKSESGPHQNIDSVAQPRPPPGPKFSLAFPNEKVTEIENQKQYIPATLCPP